MDRPTWPKLSVVLILGNVCEILSSIEKVKTFCKITIKHNLHGRYHFKDENMGR